MRWGVCGADRLGPGPGDPSASEDGWPGGHPRGAEARPRPGRGGGEPALSASAVRRGGDARAERRCPPEVRERIRRVCRGGGEEASCGGERGGAHLMRGTRRHGPVRVTGRRGRRGSVSLRRREGDSADTLSHTHRHTHTLHTRTLTLHAHTGAHTRTLAHARACACARTHSVTHIHRVRPRTPQSCARRTRILFSRVSCKRAAARAEQSALLR